MKEKFKKIYYHMMNPSIWSFIIFALLAVFFSALSVVLAIKNYNAFWTYIVYFIAFLVLAYTLYHFIYFYARIKKSIINKALKYKYLRKYINDFTFRSLVSASMSFIFNVSYAIVQGILAIIGNSIWYASLAGYYLALSLIRFGIIFKHLKRQNFENDKQYILNQLISFRNCGIYLNILTMALSISIIQMVIANQSYQYAGIMIYLMALYVFCKFIISIKNIFKAKKSKDYTTQSIRNLSLADALMSIFALQTAMFHAFGGDYDPYVFNSITGTIIALAILILSWAMIIIGIKKIRQIRNTIKKNNFSQ